MDGTRPAGDWIDDAALLGAILREGESLAKYAVQLLNRLKRQGRDTGIARTHVMRASTLFELALGEAALVIGEAEAVAPDETIAAEDVPPAADT